MSGFPMGQSNDAYGMYFENTGGRMLHFLRDGRKPGRHLTWQKKSGSKMISNQK